MIYKVLHYNPIVYYCSLDDTQAPTQRRMSAVIKFVCLKLSLPEGLVMSRSRKRPYVLSRQVITYLCYEWSLGSLDTVGEFMGGLDHTTVIHSCRVIAAMIKTGEIEDLRKTAGIDFSWVEKIKKAGFNKNWLDLK